MRRPAIPSYHWPATAGSGPLYILLGAIFLHHIHRIRNVRRQIRRQLASNLASPILDAKLDAKTDRADF